MARILVNAMSLRPGGGLQVVLGLLTELSIEHEITVVWSDQRTFEIFSRELSDRKHIEFEKPLNTTRNLWTFAWQMTRMKSYAKDIDAQLVLSINHHFPLGKIPQVVYHLSMLRFERTRQSVWSAGELQDRIRDWLSRRAIRYADANVLESRYLKNLVERVHGDINNPETIYIGLKDSSLKKKKPNKGRKAYNPAQLLVITSPQPHKDNPTLIQMLANLKQNTIICS